MANQESSMNTELNCFVVIGFGRKTDYATGRVLDLDLTYQKLIKPAFDKVGVRCFRAIDVNITGSIDKLMYQWIYHADFVVADLSTMNPNVFYELGVRHAQRPNTTLLLAESEAFKKLPFDLSHMIIYSYQHLGEDIAQEEADRVIRLLAEKVQELIAAPAREDSPVYTYLPGMEPPNWTDPNKLIEEMKEKLAEREKIAAQPLEADPEVVKKQTLAMIVQRAEAAKNAKDYPTAIALFQTASENDPLDIFLKQRLALVTYKSKEGNSKEIETENQEAIAVLKQAANILDNSCSPADTNCPETLGLSGAINKRLYERTGNMEYFDKSVEFYERGFYIKQDYYNGINVAFMYTLKATLVDNEFDAIVNYGHANMIRKKVVEICLDLIEQKDFKDRGDKEWVFQSLAQGYLGMGEMDKFKGFLPKVEALSKGAFDMETFMVHNQKLVEAIEEFKRRYALAGKLGGAEQKPAVESAATSAKPPAMPQAGGPISIDLGAHQDRPIKSLELNCRIEFR